VTEPSDGRKTAFVTGASRGIGKASAVALAHAGFDVVVTARTVAEGESREHSSTLKSSDTRPMPGSLTATAALIEAAGREVLVVPADLLDKASLVRAAQRTLEQWGRVDVIVHNGRYIGPGNMDRFLDTPIELLEKQLAANVIGPLVLNRELLPGMVARGGGTIIDITSAVAYVDPGRPAGAGGWGMGYGISKAAFHRIAGFVPIEHGEDGIRCYNVQPGMVDTERGGMDNGQFGFGGWGAPPEVVGAVVAWLASDPAAAEFDGSTIEAQFFCHEHGLLPGWPGPTPNHADLLYDESAPRLRQLEESLRATYRPPAR
jgi:NAD(P)-dependent dehydrogenase (short-subunit alcohol dehydrogenase family)